jgi:hypothetical protein
MLSSQQVPERIHHNWDNTLDYHLTGRALLRIAVRHRNIQQRFRIGVCQVPEAKHSKALRGGPTRTRACASLL